MKLLPALLLLAGCGAPPICEADGLSLIRADVPVSCATFAANAAMARHILGRKHIDARQYLPLFEGVTVTVLDEASWWSPVFNREVGGEYWSATHGITLSRDGRHLLHEMFHHLDVATGVHGTANHPHWLERGFGASEEEFQRSMQPLDAAR